MPRGGKRPKLTPERQKKILDALSGGGYFEVACEYAGVDARTGFEWLQRGRGEHPTRPCTALYAQFAQAVEKAQADDEVHTIARIKQAGQGGAIIYEKVHRKPDIITTNEKGVTVEKRGETVTERRYTSPDWTADAWRSERKHTQRWGRKDRVDVHHFITEEIERIAHDVELSAEEKQALIADVEAFAYGRT